MGFRQRNILQQSGLTAKRSYSFSGLTALAVSALALFLCVSCSTPTSPRPYGYYRITTPDTAYTDFQLSTINSQLSTPPSGGWGAYPYTFSVSRNAIIQPQEKENERYWINLYYPSLNATIHCSYKPVHNNLRELTNDALEFVYRNASFATAIPEQDYSHPEANVYGVLFDLEGNTASSCQFFVTDSTRHFFRASVYCNCPPNADSLAPVYQYLRTDIIKMVETFQWQ